MSVLFFGQCRLTWDVIRLYRKETTACKDQKILSKTRHIETTQFFLWAMTSESSCKTVPFVDQDSKTFRFASVRVWPAKKGMTRTLELWKVWRFFVQWRQKWGKQIAKWITKQAACKKWTDMIFCILLASSSLWHLYLRIFRTFPGSDP